MKKGYLAAVMALAMMSGDGIPTYTREKEDPKQRERRLKAVKEKRYKEQGLQLFDIDGKKVWALNRKNAERKAKK